MKRIILFVALLLVGCEVLPTGDTGHYRRVSGYDYYYVDQNQYQLKVRDELIRTFYRPGIHGNTGTKKLAVSEINVTLQLDEDLDKITATSGLGRSITTEELKNHPYDSPMSRFWSGYGVRTQCQEEAHEVAKLPFQRMETAHYKLHTCPDTLVLTEKATNQQCTIDLKAFNDKYFKTSYSDEYPLSTNFDYALQDADGSVIVRANNWGYIRARKISLYQLSCDGKPVEKNIDIDGMGEQFFILHVSNYGTPTAVLQYNNRQNNRIVTLDGETQYDGPTLQDLGWTGLLLPEQKVYYYFDTKLKEGKGKDQFELVITRYNYGKGSVEEKRILIEPPTKQ